MTDEQEIARIMELRGQGFNAEQIGKKLFFSGAAIRKKVRKAGLSEQYHKMSGKSVLEMNRDDIREMIESGALLVFGAVFTAELSVMGAAEYTGCAVTGLGLMTGAGISALMEDRK